MPGRVRHLLAFGLVIGVGVAPPAWADGTTERVSVATGGAQAGGNSAQPAISALGRFVAFSSDAPDLVPNDTNGVRDVFVHDRQTGVTRRVSVATGGAQAGGGSTIPAISAEGRFVAFASGTPDLVPNDTNGTQDVFVHTR
jgi:Tol biopolymer transport system component